MSIRSLMPLLALILGTTHGSPTVAASDQGLAKYPKEISSDCQYKRAKLYDQCGSQMRLFEHALEEANASEKTLLVSYGAEWCIWCHVFDQYIAGGYGDMEFRYGDQDGPDYDTFAVPGRNTWSQKVASEVLANFIRESFVIVHIDAQHAPDGYDVIETSGALAQYQNWIPFVFTVKPNGQFAAAMDYEKVQTKETSNAPYPGYFRAPLMLELSRMKSAAD